MTFNLTGFLFQKNLEELMMRYWNTELSPSFEMIDLPFYGEWFSGRDLGRFDADGYRIYEGRSNDLMNAGGYRLSPAGIERVLHRHAGVADVAVVETPLDNGSSIITAAVDLDRSIGRRSCEGDQASVIQITVARIDEIPST